MWGWGVVLGVPCGCLRYGSTGGSANSSGPVWLAPGWRETPFTAAARASRTRRGQSGRRAARRPRPDPFLGQHLQDERQYTFDSVHGRVPTPPNPIRAPASQRAPRCTFSSRAAPPAISSCRSVQSWAAPLLSSAFSTASCTRAPPPFDRNSPPGSSTEPTTPARQLGQHLARATNAPHNA